MRLNSKGMTLIELLIALVIVILVLAAAFWSFARLFQGFKSQTKVSEAHISSLIAFELLRKDLEMAGFGVPYNCSGISFNEASVSPASTYNENGTEVHPFSLGNGSGSGNSDYLVIRSVFNPEDLETEKWMYFVAANSTISQSGGSCNATLKEGNGHFSDGTHVIVEDGTSELRNIQKASSDWKFSITGGKLNKCPDNLPDETNFYLVYGVRSNAGPVIMPFNRFDYYLKKPSTMPGKCAKEFNVYELYRTHIKHGSSGGSNAGKLDEQPILDCVRDFQVSFFVKDNASSSWQETPPSSALDQKRKIKEVRVFILYQEGQKERSIVSNSTITLGDSDTGTLSTFTPTGNEQYYHWQVKEISVKPMNLWRQQ